MRRLLRIVLAIFASAVLVEALASIGMRVVTVPYSPLHPPYLNAQQREQLQALLDHQPTYVAFDPTLGWTNRPNAVSADGLYRSNAQGLRADREYSPALPADHVRILAYGDSYTQSDDVTYDDSWEVQLAARRPEVEVLNAGVAGYTLDQELLRFEEKSPRVASDIVLIGFMAENINRIVNVFRPFYLTVGTPLAKPRFVLRGDDLVLLPNPLQDEDDLRRLLAGDPRLLADMAAHDYWYDVWPIAGREDVFATVRLIKATWSAAKHVLHPDSLIDWRGIYKPTSEGFVITVKLFNRFVREAVARGELPLIVLFPNAQDLYRGLRERYAPLARTLQDEGLAVIDCETAFSQPASAYGITAASIHYPAAGDAVVADTIGRYLTEHDLLRRDRVQAAVATLKAHGG